MTETKRIEKLPNPDPADNAAETGGESAIDTKIEVDLLCGGVGFDDDSESYAKELKKARNKQKNNPKGEV